MTDREADETFLQAWIRSATDEQVMQLCAEIVRIAPEMTECFRALLMVLVTFKKRPAKSNDKQ